MAARFPRRLTALPGGGGVDGFADIRLVVDDYLTPAAAALKESADAGDVDAVRAYAYELLVASGTVIAACPRSRRGNCS